VDALAAATFSGRHRLERAPKLGGIECCC